MPPAKPTKPAPTGPFSGPCALVTGASRGLGLALAKALAQAGWALLLTARSPVELQAAAESCEALGSPLAIPLPGDLTDPKHQAALAEAATQSFGHLKALVNNAAQLGDPRLPPLREVPPGQLEALLRVNLLAPLALVQACAPLLGEGACILNLSSDAAGSAYPGWGAYGLTKAALEHASATLAEEEPQWRVHWVDPGEMRTAMYAAHLPGDLSHLPTPEEAAVPHLMGLLLGEDPSGFSEATPCPQTGRRLRP